MAHTRSSLPRFLDGVEAALQRASQRARTVAEQTHTPVVVFKDGKIERQLPADTPTFTASTTNKR